MDRMSSVYEYYRRARAECLSQITFVKIIKTILAKLFEETS